MGFGILNISLDSLAANSWKQADLFGLRLSCFALSAIFLFLLRFGISDGMLS